MTKEFEIMTPDLSWYKEVNVKGGKDHVVTGFISTTHVDLQQDEITENCLYDMNAQLKSRKYTLDMEHEAFEGHPVRLPVGDIVHSEIRPIEGNRKGIWVKARINPHHDKFNKTWSSIEDGFIGAFSIAYNPVKAVYKHTANGTIRALDKLSLRNVGLTGAPVNNHTLIDSFKRGVIMKSIKALNNSEEMKMNNQNEVNTEINAPVDPAIVELKSLLAAQNENFNKQMAEMRDVNAKHTEAMSAMTTAITNLSQISQPAQNVELKSQLANLNKEITSLKNTPIYKGIAVPADIHPEKGVMTNEQINQVELKSQAAYNQQTANRQAIENATMEQSLQHQNAMNVGQHPVPNQPQAKQTPINKVKSLLGGI